MKKCVAILLCVCSLCTLAITASASDNEPDFIAEYEAQYGKAPVAGDFSSDEEYQAAYGVWFAGLVPYINRRAAEYERQKSTEAEAAQEDAETESSVTPFETVESVGSNNENNPSAPVSSGSADKYPVGSYVSPAGNVYSPDGTLLSPGTTPAMEPNEDASPQAVDPEVVEITLELLYELLSDVASDTEELTTDEAVAYVVDLRPIDPPVTVLDGLKALVNSVFGEYTPVTTNTVVTQTIGNDTYEYLVETVAPGAAGVDYEWVAGVFLFGIMLFCLMKLLGGVLK